MALGTITIQSVRENRDGGQEILCSCAGDSDYPTGGTLALNAKLQAAIKTAHANATDHHVRGEEEVEIMYIVPVSAGAFVPSYAYATDKLFVYSNATDAECALHDDLHLTTFQFVAVCK